MDDEARSSGGAKDMETVSSMVEWMTGNHDGVGDDGGGFR